MPASPRFTLTPYFAHERRMKLLRSVLLTTVFAASRLKGAGVGPYAPGASNRTDEGRALNRRVELVEQKIGGKVR
jgi:outer membrane protein OmpA-like peptidoglycan-associated protein